MQAAVDAGVLGIDGPTAVVEERPKPERVRLDYLDGLRGLAALYVVISHVTLECLWHDHDAGLSKLGHRIISASECGRYAVALFIVLSGYCLMLPVARSADGALRGGAMEYLRRRARRILPPYYAALIVSLVLIKLVPALQVDSGILANNALPWNTPGILLSHGLLLHNLSNSWAYKINDPMWSVATEWQIYFFFPAVLLPLWRRFGLLAPIAAGFALGFLPHVLHQFRFDVAAPWYLGLFAIGMAAAVVNFSARPNIERIRRAIPWGTLSLILTAILMVATIKLGYVKRLVYLEIFASLPAMCFIIYLTHATREGRRPILLRLLQHKAVVALGVFSYSLYLTHVIVVEIFHAWVAGTGVSSWRELLLELFVCVPLCVLFAYGFHVLFERRFMTTHSTATKTASSVGSPTPKRARP